MLLEVVAIGLVTGSAVIFCMKQLRLNNWLDNNK